MSRGPAAEMTGPRARPSPVGQRHAETSFPSSSRASCTRAFRPPRSSAAPPRAWARSSQRRVPLLAVPLLDLRHAVTLVILAGDLEGADEPLHAELLEPLLGDVQVLEAPADLLPGEGLIAHCR